MKIPSHFSNNANTFSFMMRMYTVRNVRKFTKFVSYKGNVKFDDIYVFDQRYLKIVKNVLNFLKFYLTFTKL